MRNEYSSHSPAVTMPATGSFVITPGTAFAQGGPIRQITIGVAGTLAWKDQNGAIQLTADLPAGSYPIMATSIETSGTTATQLTGWY